MKEIPKIYYNVAILDIIDRLIGLGYKSFDEIYHRDKLKLAGHCFNIAEGGEIQIDFSPFGKFAVSQTLEDLNYLITTISSGVIDHFRDILVALFEERFEKYCEPRKKDDYE